MQDGNARPPVGVDGSHHRARLKHGFHPVSDVIHLFDIRPRHAPGNREGRVRAKHQLRYPDARFGGKAVGDSFSQPELERLA